MSKRETIINWIFALRSDCYTQGRRSLRTLNDEYCCLGVLADTISKEWKKSSYFGFYEWGKDRQSAGFAKERLEKMGLTYKQQCQLWLMNDHEKKSFKEIADYIEQEILPFVED